MVELKKVLSVLIFISALSLTGCKNEKLDTKAAIVNGRSVKQSEAPFIVKIRSGITMCTGALINNRELLTAAHCVYNPNSLTSRTGIEKLVGIPKLLVYPQFRVDLPLGDSGKFESVSVSRVSLPTQYREVNKPSLDDTKVDLAILTLALPLDFTGKHKHLSALPLLLSNKNNKFTKACEGLHKGYYTNTKARAYGWHIDKKTFKASRLLQVAEYILRSPKYCRDSLPNRRNPYLCANSVMRSDTCQGDSGTPLVLKDARSGRDFMIGPSVSGGKCGSGTFYNSICRHFQYLSSYSLYGFHAFDVEKGRTTEYHVHGITSPKRRNGDIYMELIRYY